MRFPRDSWAYLDHDGDLVQVVGVTHTPPFGLVVDLVAIENGEHWMALVQQLTGAARELADALIEEARR